MPYFIAELYPSAASVVHDVEDTGCNGDHAIGKCFIDLPITESSVWQVCQWLSQATEFCFIIFLLQPYCKHKDVRWDHRFHDLPDPVRSAYFPLPLILYWFLSL